MSCTVESAPRGRKAKRSEDEVADDEHDRGGDDLVEGVLKKAAEPSPEEPLQLGDDEKGHEDRARRARTRRWR